jgi:hypothetical protein
VAWEGSWQFGSNKAKALAVDANLQWLLAFNDEQRRLSGAVTLYWQARSNIELSLGGNAGAEHATRFYDCATDSGRACLVEPGMRHYTFADLDSRFVSLTLRGTLTLRPELSFQTYLQYFVAKGDYSDFKRIDTVGQHPEIRRDESPPVGPDDRGRLREHETSTPTSSCAGRSAPARRSTRSTPARRQRRSPPPAASTRVRRKMSPC